MVAYQDPLLQQMRGSLRAPRCLGTGEQGEAAVWMALEDLSELDQRPWPESRFSIVSRHLGEFNGSFLAGPVMPSPSWLSRDWLQGWTERAEPMITLLPGVADHPLVSRAFPSERIETLLEVWEQRQAWYAALNALPQTICHQDVFPRNAFVHHADPAGQADETIAIDWAFCGKGPVGAELAALIEGALAFFELERDAADRVEAQCLTSYMEGLADAVWEGAAEDVQLGYLASFVLRGPIGTVGPVLTVLLDETLHGLIEHIFGQPMDVFVTNSIELAEFERQRITRARRLLADR